jgi:hypothetical protein
MIKCYLDEFRLQRFNDASTAFSLSQTRWEDLTNGELEGIWKEAMVAYLKLPFQHLPANI